MPKAKNKTTKVREEFPFSDLPFVKDTWENGEQTRCWWAVEDEERLTDQDNWNRGSAYAILYAQHVDKLGGDRHWRKPIQSIFRDMQDSIGSHTGAGFLATLAALASCAISNSRVSSQWIAECLGNLKPQDSHTEHRAAA